MQISWKILISDNNADFSLSGDVRISCQMPHVQQHLRITVVLGSWVTQKTTAPICHISRQAPNNCSNYLADEDVSKDRPDKRVERHPCLLPHPACYKLQEEISSESRETLNDSQLLSAHSHPMSLEALKCYPHTAPRPSNIHLNATWCFQWLLKAKQIFATMFTFVLVYAHREQLTWCYSQI